MLPQSFYFIRHGQTDWNLEGRMQGHTDVLLNATGIMQAERAVGLIQSLGLVKVFSSDLMRARQTAEIISQGVELPLVISEGLRERCFGDIEGLTEADIEAQEKIGNILRIEPIEENGMLYPRRAETYSAFTKRILSCLELILQEEMGNRVIIVSHGGVFTSLVRSLLGEFKQSKNVSPYYFEKTASGWKLHDLSEEA